MGTRVDGKAMPWMRLPTYSPDSVEIVHRDAARHADGQPVVVTATARLADDYSSRAMPCHPAGGPVRRLRHERHRGPDKGWRSKFHPKILDYRTVDELGLKVHELDAEAQPRTKAAKQAAEVAVEEMFVEGGLLHADGEDPAASSITLTPDKPHYGEVKPNWRKADTSYSFFRITVCRIPPLR